MIQGAASLGAGAGVWALRMGGIELSCRGLAHVVCKHCDHC